MRSYLFLPSLILSAVLCFLPTYGSSETEHAPSEHDHLAGHDHDPSSLPPSSASHIITVTDDGISPSTLRMNKKDKMAFFLNDSSDSLITIALNYGKHTTHCSSANLTIGEDGTIRSKEPIAPKDFAGSCFHDTGSYTYSVMGLKKYPQGLTGTIRIE